MLEATAPIGGGDHPIRRLFSRTCHTSPLLISSHEISQRLQSKRHTGRLRSNGHLVTARGHQPWCSTDVERPECHRTVSQISGARNSWRVLQQGRYQTRPLQKGPHTSLGLSSTSTQGIGNVSKACSLAKKNAPASCCSCSSSP